MLLVHGITGDSRIAQVVEQRRAAGTCAFPSLVLSPLGLLHLLAQPHKLTIKTALQFLLDAQYAQDSDDGSEGRCQCSQCNRTGRHVFTQPMLKPRSTLLQSINEVVHRVCKRKW